MNIEQLENRLIALEEENEELRQRLDNLEDFEYKQKEFNEPMAIGSEQLWEVVYNDILKSPVPSGIDSRDMLP